MVRIQSSCATANFMKLLSREAAKLAFKFLIFHFKSLYLKKKKKPVQRTDLSKVSKGRDGTEPPTVYQAVTRETWTDEELGQPWIFTLQLEATRTAACSGLILLHYVCARTLKGYYLPGNRAVFKRLTRIMKLPKISIYEA